MYRTGLVALEMREFERTHRKIVLVLEIINNKQLDKLQQQLAGRRRRRNNGTRPTVTLYVIPR